MFFRTYLVGGRKPARVFCSRWGTGDGGQRKRPCRVRSASRGRSEHSDAQVTRGASRSVGQHLERQVFCAASGFQERNKAPLGAIRPGCEMRPAGLTPGSCAPFQDLSEPRACQDDTWLKASPLGILLEAEPLLPRPLRSASPPIPASPYLTGAGFL